MKDLSILVVDDSEFMQNIIKKALERAGFSKIWFANSGNKALETLEKMKFDIMFLDINMLDGDGLQTLKEINKKHDESGFKKPKCVIISAVEQEVVKEEAVKLGAIGYIQKPFEEKDIADILNKVIEGET